jgi:environmental stress-induced protein Ves
MPWKNGGGETLEIVSHPADAGMDAFAWRVSVADIAQDGPFSQFPGVDRTLVLMTGRGIRLISESGDPFELHVPFEPVTFPGESPLRCSLIDGPTRDFNFMVRRGVVSGEVVVVREGSQALAPAAAYVCFAAAGTCECLLAGFPPLELAPLHALVVQPDAAAEPAGLHVYSTSAHSVALVAVIDVHGTSTAQ